jgi:glycerol-3-phosphate dehydrogenase
MLGAFRRERPRRLAQFAESSILIPGNHQCYEYEEGYLPDSDARFVIEWILRARDIANPALNHCAVRGGHYDNASRLWRLDLDDRVLNRQFTAQAKLVVNAAGVWTDALNREFGIEAPYKHILS